MADNDFNKDLAKWKSLIVSGSERLEKEIKDIPRDVVLELSRDPVLGPRLSEAINRVMSKANVDTGGVEGEAAGGPSSGVSIKSGHAAASKDYREDEEKKLSLHAQIQRMDVGQKAKLAREGSQTARAILIKEGNKIIALAVLANPKITTQEIEAIAASRNVSEDVLREISRNKDWTKGYAVVLALANNPKTPIGITLTYLPKLLTRDLRSLAKSKGVPEVIRVMSRKMAQKRRT